MKSVESVESVEERIKELCECLKIQTQTGIWDYNEYQFGIANGLILALSILENSDLKYLERPEFFNQELQIMEKLNNSGIILNNHLKKDTQ